jgi:MFS family permease
MSFRQSRTPDELQARNTTLRSLSRAVIVMISPVAGLLADRIGLREGLTAAAVIFGAATLMLALSSFRRVRGWTDGRRRRTPRPVLVQPRLPAQSL